MSETEAGSSWQQHYVWGMTYPHHQHNLHQIPQYQSPYHQQSPHNASGPFSSVSDHQHQQMQMQAGVSLQEQSNHRHFHHHHHPHHEQYQQRNQGNIRRHIPYDATAGRLALGFDASCFPSRN